MVVKTSDVVQVSSLPRVTDIPFPGRKVEDEGHTGPAEVRIGRRFGGNCQ